MNPSQTFKRGLGIAVLKVFPDWTMPGLNFAEQFANQVINKVTTHEGKTYCILHAWAIPETLDQKGQVLGFCVEVGTNDF